MTIVYVVAYCDPQCEHIAVQNLAEQDYWPYLPVERYHSRRLHRVAERPLFSRYVFVGVDVEARQDAGKSVYRPISGTRGVRDYLRRADGSPGLLEPSLVEGIRRAEQAGIFDRLTHARLAKGAKVRVEEGPMAGLIGEIKDAGNRKRVQILFQMLGREVVVSAPLGLITPA